MAHGLLAVCVHPVHVARAAGALKELLASGAHPGRYGAAASAVHAMPTGDAPFVVSVVGFPFGLSQPSCKASEAALAVAHGAREVDMVIRLDLLKEGRLAEAEADVAGVVRAVSGHAVKVIIETGLLSDELKRAACAVAESAGAAFVKTSTGYLGPGATVEDVRLLRAALPCSVGVKASGGIRTAPQARALLEAGAGRIGCSASLDIVAGDMAGDFGAGSDGGY